MPVGAAWRFREGADPQGGLSADNLNGLDAGGNVYRTWGQLLQIDVSPLYYWTSPSSVTSLAVYAGATGQAVPASATSYVYLDSSNSLVINQSGFPTYSSEAHVPLAVVVTDAQTITSISDRRPRIIRPGDFNEAASVKNTRMVLTADTALYNSGLYIKVAFASAPEDTLGAANLSTNQLEVPAESDGKLWWVYAELLNYHGRDPYNFYIAHKNDGGGVDHNYSAPSMLSEVSGIGDTIFTSFFTRVSEGDFFEYYAYHAEGSAVQFVHSAVLAAVEVY